MGNRTQHTDRTRDHIVPALEAAIAGLSLATAGGSDCPPMPRQRSGCPVTAQAMVVDQRISTEVFDFLRGLNHPWDSALPGMPRLAEILVSDSGRVTVHFLRN